MKKHKVKISKPKETMAYGGQTGYALDTGGRFDNQHFNDYPNPFDYSGNQLNTTLSPVSRDEANIEAERGETVVADFQNNGGMSHLKVGGKRHSQGGTPLNVPDDAFVFSDTPKMKMGGAELTAFGKSDKGDKKYTPAQLAKQYDINKYQAIIDDPTSDHLQRKTAELMLGNYQKKLSQLSLVQEAKKGFPNGIPELAIPYLQTMSDISEGASEGATEGVFAFGGQFADGGERYNPFDINPYKGGRTRKGTITPTGKNNAFNRGKDYLKSWEGIIPGISKLSNQEAQGQIYDYTMKNNPESIRDMWSTYGMTAKGLKSNQYSNYDRSGKFTGDQLSSDESLAGLRDAYADGFFGVRQLDPTQPVNSLPPTAPPPSVVTPPATPPAEVVPPVTTPTPVPGGPTPGDFSPSSSKGVFDYMTPDKLNFAAGMRNRANINKYMPWEAPVSAQTIDPTFYDPNRELAANESSAATQMQYNAQFSGPQSLGARNSAVAGQSAENAANILARVNGQNVGVANQFAGVNAEIMNRLTDAQGQRATRLFDKSTVANQQYDNAVRTADNQILKAGINAWDNRSQLGMVNDTNPYYYVDPNSGRMVFKGGKSISSTPGATPAGAGTYNDYYKAAIAQGMDDEYAKRYAYDMLKGGKTTTVDKNNDGIVDSVRAQQSGYRAIRSPQ